MALTTSTRSYIGKGKLYVGKRSGGIGNLPIGNCAGLSLEITEDKKELPDYTSAGGGFKDTLSRITGVTGTVNIHDFSPANLALALRSEVSDGAAGSVTTEAHTAFTDAFIDFTSLPDITVTVTPTIVQTAAWVAETAYNVGDTIKEDTDKIFQCTVAGTSGASGAEPTWTGHTLGDVVSDGATLKWTYRGTTAMADGTDYEKGKAGIHILATASRFALGLPINVAYSKNAAQIVQALISSAIEYTMFADLLNEVDGGNPFAVKMHRIKFSPTAGLELIGDDFGALELNFDILQDTTISGTDISQYMKISQVAG